MYLPFITDAKHIGQNVYGSTMHGFDFTTDLRRGNFKDAFKPRGTHIGSVGGAFSAFGAMGIGAAAGAAIGSQMGDTMGEGAKTGAMVGAAAGAVAPFALGFGMNLGVGLGKGALELGASAVGVAPKIAAGTVGLAGHVINGVNHGGIASTALSPLRRWGAAADKVGNSLFKMGEASASKTGLAKELESVTKLRPTALGVGVIAGTSVIAGAASAFKEMNRARMGQSDGQITRATPRMQPTFNNGGSGGAYADNAGATGDLVFALNANRRG